MYKFGGNRGTFTNFVEIEGICNMYHWLRGDRRPWSLGHSSFRLLLRVLVFLGNYSDTAWITWCPALSPRVEL